MHPETLTIAEICRQTGFDRNVLNRYLAESENRAFFGGEATHPLYPTSSLPQFFQLADQHSKGIVKPKTLAAIWRNRDAEGETIRNSHTDNRIANTEYRTSNTEQALTLTPSGIQQGAAIFAEEIIAALLRAGVVIGDDRLLTAQEAATFLACKPQSVRRYVRPVRRGIYRLSDVQGYIRSLPAIAA